MRPESGGEENSIGKARALFFAPTFPLNKFYLHQYPNTLRTEHATSTLVDEKVEVAPVFKFRFRLTPTGRTSIEMI